MFKSALFFAVQCCQCSTMQVKQQKKSSNKWNCVVCNQKQSVKKVYAQGYQAKDIRHVVQSLNMSRKFDDDQLHQQQIPFVQHLEDNLTMTGDDKAKRRTDWSEYIDDGNDNFEPDYLKSKCNDSEKEMVAESKIVTEFNKDLMFKKPKLKGKFSSFSSSDKESYKPRVSNRVSTKETSESRANSSDHGSLWDEGIVSDDDLIRGDKQQQEKVSTLMKKSDFPWNTGIQCEQQQRQPKKSKWSKYITDDDGGGEEVKLAFTDDLSLMCGNNDLEEEIDQPVEEDIHPDFM